MRIAGARKARLSVPRVNQNPRIGNARNVTGRAGLANRIAATAPHTPATTTAQTSNAATPATQTSNVDPLQAATPAAATERFAMPTYAPQPGQDDPRDATYWANLAKLKFSDEQEYGKLEQEQTRSNSAFTDATQTAIRNRLGQQRGLGENVMRGNLGASGYLDRTEAEQTSQYTQERAHAQLSKTEEDHARAAAMHALEEGWGIDTATLLAEAAGRYSKGAGGEAENAEPETPAAAQGSGPGARAGKGKGKHGIASNRPAPAPGPAVGPGRPLRPAKAAIAKRRKAR